MIRGIKKVISYQLSDQNDGSHPAGCWPAACCLHLLEESLDQSSDPINLKLKVTGEPGRLAILRPRTWSYLSRTLRKPGRRRDTQVIAGRYQIVYYYLFPCSSVLVLTAVQAALTTRTSPG